MDDVTAGKSALCLFDDFSAPNSRVVWDHMRDVHNFTLQGVGVEPSDDLRRITVVNYLRSIQLNGGNVLQAAKEITPESKIWSDESHLKMKITNDRLLWDLGQSGDEEEEDQEDDDEDDDDLDTSTTNTPNSENSPGYEFNRQDDGYYHHQHGYKPRRYQNQRQQLWNRRQRRFRGGNNHQSPQQTQRPHGQQWNPRRSGWDNSRRQKEIEDNYFESYDAPDVHRSMISDLQRTYAYRDFILQNADAFKDKVVLDVGCGTGILSFYAHQAGAKFIVGVDAAASTATMASMIAKDNAVPASKFSIVIGMLEQITIVVCDQPDGTMQAKAIPRGALIEDSWRILEADIIVSEWMGYGMMFESMLRSVIHARNKYLVKGGLMVPNRMSVHLTLADMSENLHTLMSQWDSNQTKERLGLDLARLRPIDSSVLQVADVLVIPPCLLRSEPVQVGELDVTNATDADCRCLFFDFEVQADPNFRQRTKAALGDSCCPKCALQSASKQKSDQRTGDQLFNFTANEWYQKGGFGAYNVEPEEPVFTSLVMHFDAHFDSPLEGGKSFVMSTSPLMPATHWGQTILHLRSRSTSRIEILCSRASGDLAVVKGNISLNRHADNYRHLKIHLELEQELEARNGTVHSENRFMGKELTNKSTAILLEASSHFLFEMR